MHGSQGYVIKMHMEGLKSYSLHKCVNNDPPLLPTCEHCSVAKSLAIEQRVMVSGALFCSANAAFLTISREATRFVAISARRNCRC